MKQHEKTLGKCGSNATIKIMLLFIFCPFSIMIVLVVSRNDETSYLTSLVYRKQMK